MKRLKSAILGSAILSNLILGSAAWSADTPVDNSVEITDTIAGAGRSEPDPESQLIAALAREQTPETEVIWLETAKEARLALYQPTGSVQSNGGILIFHDRQTSPDWPEIVRPLRTQLTLHGWSTLSVSIPYPAQIAVPERTLAANQADGSAESIPDQASAESNATPAASTATVKTAKQQVMKDSYQETFIRIAQAASEQLNVRNHNRQVVIGIGDGALWGAAYVQQSQQSQDLHLIMINPTQPADPLAPELLELIPQLSATTLDLYFSSAPTQTQQALHRKRTALRHKLTNYKQFRVNQLADDYKKQQQWLTRQVRGLLKTYIIKADEKKLLAAPAIEAESSQLTPGS